MKIGILKETKIPEDNRVALTPNQIQELSLTYPNIEFKVQSSDIRAYSDNEYTKVGVKVSNDISDCDILLGIKEADIETLLPNKHYVFFGHIAKMQPYNKDLFKRLIDLKDTFSDYEYLTGEDGHRLVAFGWYAGVVGLYYTLIGWGIKTKTYTLPMPNKHFSVEDIICNIKNVSIPATKMIVTGNGRVSNGAQYILKSIGAKRIDSSNFLTYQPTEGIAYCVLTTEKLVAPNNPRQEFESNDFKIHPENYHQIFDKYFKSADILLSCHYWANKQPVYLSKQDFLSEGFRFKMIGDITCDIQGSIYSTLRSSTHCSPFYDYNPITGQEEEAFSSNTNVTVMAVDTCPNALPRETSRYFGEELTKHVLNDLFAKETTEFPVLERSTILRDGELAPYFTNLNSYIATF